MRDDWGASDFTDTTREDTPSGPTVGEGSDDNGWGEENDDEGSDSDTIVEGNDKTAAGNEARVKFDDEKGRERGAAMPRAR